MKQYKQEEIEVIISNASKPKLIANSKAPLNDLDDRLFEVLTYSVFKNRLHAEKQLKRKYDDVILMQGVGEKGMDCILTKNNKIAAIIQCKKYRNNLSDTIILKELVKFSLHVLNSPDLFSTEKKITYCIVTSTGYSGKSILLPNMIKEGKVAKEYDLDKIIQEALNKYKEFKALNVVGITNRIATLIKAFSYDFIRPDDLNLWINDYPNMIETFFDIKKVTDNGLLDQRTKEIINTIKESFPSQEAEVVEKLIETYKSVAKEKLNVVNFIGFDIQKHRQRPEDITLTDLFVQPSFQQRINKKNEKVFSVVEKELKITNLLKSEKNIIILGDPGAGKSLLVKYLMVSIISNKSERLGIMQLANYLPLRVELRKYNEVMEQRSITEHIRDTLNKDFQTNISTKQLEKILENGPSIVFFDGLDEVFNISNKTKIKDDIEAFSLRYKGSKCIVTSRFIGYHDIKFNQKRFDEFAILKFNKAQIRELVTKFYESQQSNPEKKRRAIDTCIQQLDTEVDIELKSNPLILTLILILTSNNIIIPDSKLEIYESCTKTLVDSIDTKEKELKIEIPVKNKNLTFSHLAYWQYESLSKGAEVSNAKAIKTLADFLMERKEFTDFSDAEMKAEKFLEYAERRSIYFDNNFTHKTFLEYFTAEYLYSTCIAKASDSGRRKLISVSSKYLSSSFWYIVFELLYTRIDRVQPDNELLDEVFEKQIESNSLDVFYFLVSNVGKFSNVSHETKCKIIERALMLCIRGEKMKKELRAGFLFEENSILYKINNLRKNKETGKILQDVFCKLERDGLSEKQEIELYNLYYEIISYEYRLPMKGYEKFEVENVSRINELANKDLLLYSKVYLSRNDRAQKIDVSILLNQIEHFGHKSLFSYIPLRHIENSRRVDTFDLYLMHIIESGDYESFLSDINQLLSYGLKPEDILSHVNDTRLFYFTRSEALDKILKIYLRSEDSFIDNILEKMIRRDHDMKVAYEKYRSENNNIKLKRIDKLFGKKNKVKTE